MLLVDEVRDKGVVQRVWGMAGVGNTRREIQSGNRITFCPKIECHIPDDAPDGTTAVVSA